MPVPNEVVIRPGRIQMLGYGCGCSTLLVIALVVGLQSMLALRAAFAPFAVPTIWVYGIGFLVLEMFVVWYFFAGIPRVWNQKIVFGQRTFSFKDDEKEEEIIYDRILGVEVEQHQFTGFDGGSHQPFCRIVFQYYAPEPTTTIFRCDSFSLHSVLKMVVELSGHNVLESVRISRLRNFDNERDLHSAAKGLGEISFDESSNCFWFTPRHS